MVGRKESVPTLEGHSHLCCISETIGKVRREVDLVFTECLS